MSRSRSLTIGAVISLAILLIAAVSFIWVPYDVTQLSIPDKLQRPNWTHWLGTDHFGRDLFSMIMVGARTSIAVALLAVGIGIGLGVPLGLAAAARQGSLLDEVIMRTNDLIFAFPSLVIAILITGSATYMLSSTQNFGVSQNVSPLAQSTPMMATMSPASAKSTSSRLSACIRTMRLKRCFCVVRWLM